MALTEAQVLEALRPVQDPELHVSIVELGMVRAIRVKRGRVHVTVALTIAGCPMQTEIRQLVTAAVGGLGGVKEVEVELGVMSEAELAALRTKITGEASGPPGGGHDGHSHAGHQHGTAQPLGHEEGLANQFMSPSNRTRILGISSGKGGVGKSSVTVNLAIALVKAGHSVAVLDADVYGFSIPRMLGLSGQPSVDNEKVQPPEAFGVRCISIGFFVGEDQPVMWRGPMLHKALEQFLVDVEWGQPDFLLVDMPPGTGDVALSMAQYLPRSEVYVVTTPQDAAKRVAQRTAYMAKKLNLPLRGVIENMSWFTGNDGTRYELFGRGGGAELAEELGVPLLGQIPLVPALRQGGDDGQPITVSEPDGEASLAFDHVAKQLITRGAGRVFRPELTIR